MLADPGLIGADPYGKGWLLRVQISELPSLMSADEYRVFADDAR
ncbi:hypothetical protein [Micromonospora sp. DT227]